MLLSLLPDAVFKAIAAGLPWALNAAGLSVFVYGQYRFFWNNWFFWRKWWRWDNWKNGNVTGLRFMFASMALHALAHLACRLKAPRDLDDVLSVAIIALLLATQIPLMEQRAADRQPTTDGAA